MRLNISRYLPRCCVAGDGEVRDGPVPHAGGVQGGHPEHRAQRGHLPRRPQQHGGPGQADVQRLRLRHHRAHHLQRLLQVPQFTNQ